MYIIQGGQTLSGKIKVQGSKNSSLPILAATIINGKKNVICDVPRIRDIDVMCQILSHLGAGITRHDNVIEVDSERVNSFEVPEQLMREMRSSIILMGALLGRYGKAKVSYPGGCEIGPRPIDLHLKGLSSMGVVFSEGHGFLYGKLMV
mgnify:CR=1 FL=1